VRVQFGPHELSLIEGDLTDQSADALVNAANAELAGGGGVDGAIHRRGGPSIMEETRRRYPLGCPTGDAVVSTAGLLSARYVFHAVGPIWRGGHHQEERLLRSAYRRCLDLAVQHACRSIAFPAISTGAYRYPIDLAAEHAIDEVSRFLQNLRSDPLSVRFCFFDAGTLSAYAVVLEARIAADDA
jgi:O-acetyl-ADP-ribose deacetylase